MLAAMAGPRLFSGLFQLFLISVWRTLYMDFELRPTFPPPTPIDPLLRRRQITGDGQIEVRGPLRGSTGAPSRPAASGRRSRRLNLVMFALASGLGLWPATSMRSHGAPGPSSPASSAPFASTASWPMRCDGR